MCRVGFSLLKVVVVSCSFGLMLRVLCLWWWSLCSFRWVCSFVRVRLNMLWLLLKKWCELRVLWMVFCRCLCIGRYVIMIVVWCFILLFCWICGSNFRFGCSSSLIIV